MQNEGWVSKTSFDVVGVWVKILCNIVYICEMCTHRLRPKLKRRYTHWSRASPLPSSPPPSRKIDRLSRSRLLFLLNYVNEDRKIRFAFDRSQQKTMWQLAAIWRSRMRYFTSNRAPNIRFCVFDVLLMMLVQYLSFRGLRAVATRAPALQAGSPSFQRNPHNITERT